MNFRDANKQTEDNKRQKLIRGYNHLVNYLDECIYKAIRNGSFEVKINEITLFVETFKVDGKCNKDVVDALIFHYKKQGANAYVHVKEEYRNAVMVEKEQRHLIINWEDCE